MKRNTIKTIGIIILILSLFFLDPIPGPTDFVALQAYSMYSGADVGLDNLSVIYADYFIWSMVVGFFIVDSYVLTGLEFKKSCGRKIDLGKYNLAVLLAVATVLFVAVFDIWSMNSGVFGSAIEYTLGKLYHWLVATLL